MHQTNHFFNLGYGWLCKHCSAEDSERKQHERTHPHEPHQHQQSHLALAKWIDEAHHGLECPRCGIVEKIART